MFYYDEKGRKFLARPKRLVEFPDGEETAREKFEGNAGDKFIRILDAEGRVVHTIFSEEVLRGARRRLEDRVRKDPISCLMAIKALGLEII
jgi:hypothetical protein